MRGSVNVPGIGGARIETGAYTGTGGDQTLTFGIKPKIICIVFEPDTIAPIFRDQTLARVREDAETIDLITVSWATDKSVTLSKVNTHGEHRLSKEGVTYRYFAIGE